MSAVLASVLLTAASLAAADAPKPADAEKVAAAASEAMTKVDWKAYAELMHPDSLTEFRKKIVPALEAADKAGKLNKELLGIFDGAEDLKTVLAWKPKEFFTRVMTSLSKVPMRCDCWPISSSTRLRSTSVSGRLFMVSMKTVRCSPAGRPVNLQPWQLPTISTTRWPGR